MNPKDYIKWECLRELVLVEVKKLLDTLKEGGLKPDLAVPTAFFTLGRIIVEAKGTQLLDDIVKQIKEV